MPLLSPDALSELSKEDLDYDTETFVSCSCITRGEFNARKWA